MREKRGVQTKDYADVAIDTGTFKDSTINNNPKNIPLDATTISLQPKALSITLSFSTIPL